MDCIICGKNVGSEAYFCVKKDMRVAFCDRHAKQYCDKCNEECAAKKNKD